MPGGTSGSDGGKNPVTTPTHTDPGGKPGSNVGKGGRRDPGGKAKSTGSESDILATIMAMAQAVKSAGVANSSKMASTENAQFSQKDFLASQNALNEAWAAEGGGVGSVTPGDVTGRVTGPGATAVVAGQMEKEAAQRAAAAGDSDAVFRAQTAYDRQLRSRRADALNTVQYGNPDKRVNIAKKTDVLTWDEYNDLSGLDKAAVDFNTMLVKAVKRDRKMQDSYNPDEQQQKNYDAAVQGMFPSGSSTTNELKYAPETVALLNQIGYNGDGQGDLNDFLQLKAAVTDKDLKRMGQSQDSGLRRGGLDFQSPVMEERMNFKTDLVNKTDDALSQAMEKGNKLLANFQTAAFETLRADTVGALGGLARSESGIGFGETEKDVEFQQMFDLVADGDLASKGLSLDTVFSTATSQWSNQDRKKFMAYAQKKLLTAAQEGINVTDSEGVTPLPPEEVAKRLKMQGFGGGENG
jgi:hypothetical protein